jgi:hydrogenase expression/formation protein HypD
MTGSEAAVAELTVAAQLAQLRASQRQPWTLMEVCGGQTHSILRWGIDQLLPPDLRLIHGPGCPVCVTPAATIDQALELAVDAGVMLCSYGDMLRVPGSGAGGSPSDLLAARAAGGDVRLVTTPLQVLQLAQAHPDREVVFLAVGFETTAPATAVLAEQVRRLGLTNLSLLLAHVRVPAAMEAVVTASQGQVQGFLAAGHVAAVMGTAELEALVQRCRIPVVISGFAAAELVAAMLACVQLLEAGTPTLVNAYHRAVRPRGNPAARALLQQVFAVADGDWRGLGTIPGGMLQLRAPYRRLGLDARCRFGLPLPGAERDAPLDPAVPQPHPCISGAVLQGRQLPCDCPSFGTACTPDHPLGAPMVSSEGACAAYHRYRRG